MSNEQTIATQGHKAGSSKDELRAMDREGKGRNPAEDGTEGPSEQGVDLDPKRRID